MISFRHGARSTNGKAKLQKRLIPHQEALRVLLTSTPYDDLPKHVQNELPAIISHWLQSPTSEPVLIDKRYGAIWRTQLSTYVDSLSSKHLLNGWHHRSAAKFTIDFSEAPFPPPE